ncbi:thiol reductant ABC exporter subunit CydC [Reticulibacter mediterranei]|uniref:Thiol reductant ABC exporter subunit CydC n=1 Tax=Reticulibacter mediterranei TaxID=2778369 RepID=A0A8J3N983_9CHLR|nr:thiol reductant ABC exporter subunit CydC [Reticulibacter mediterranei]GHP00331.1 thiol reductant ABC exporter subunit CydC [Reticulibacter mediterranei]
MEAPFWRLLTLARPIVGWLLLAVLLGVATVASGIGLMATSAYLISEAALHPSIAALEVAIVGVRFFGIARGLLRYVERLITHEATFRLLARLRVWLYAALEPLAPARLLEYVHQGEASHSSGDLLSRIVSDIEMLQNFYVRVLAPPCVAALIAVGMWLFFGAFDPRMALAFVGCFLLSAIGIPLVTYLLSRRAGQQLVEARAALHVRLVDHVQGLADVLAFGQEERARKELDVLDKKYNKAQSSLDQIGGMQEALSMICMQMTALLMLLLGIQCVRTGQFNGVFLALLVLAALSSFEAILPLPAAFQQVSSSMAAAHRLFALIDAKPALQQSQQPAPLPQNYELRIEHLRFRYTSDEADVLHDVSFSVPEGCCVALIGASGIGKSTIVHLLQRFWDYHEGHILLGERELRDYDQDEVRRLISVVSQDTHLFHTTIRANLLLAREDVSEEEMIRATQRAHIHEFILSLPRGYDTEVGEQGVRLSGGERQRLAIARALLKNAPILLLDEPTANLDAVTAQDIRQMLRELICRRTTLLITHQFADIEIADEVVVLQQSEYGCMSALKSLSEMGGEIANEAISVTGSW